MILLRGSTRGVVEFSVLFRGAPYCGVKTPDLGGVLRLRVFFYTFGYYTRRLDRTRAMTGFWREGLCEHLCGGMRSRLRILQVAG